MIETDFGGRSIDFQNDETISEYQPIIGTLMNRWQNSGQKPSPASAVAAVIHRAVTDGTNTLRYRAREDANQILDTLKKMSDDEFTAMIKSQLGL